MPRPPHPGHTAIKLVILGRDGIINHYREGHVKEPAEWQPVAGALEALARLSHAGWRLVVATNQAGVGRGLVDMAVLNAVHRHMSQQLATHGGRIDAVFFCPHAPEEACDCRKPAPGMLLDIGRRYGAHLSQVPLVGDTLRDLLAAQAAGCQPHLLRTGRAAQLPPQELAQWLAQVPNTTVHDSLDAFVDSLLQHKETA